MLTFPLLFSDILPELGPHRRPAMYSLRQGFLPVMRPEQTLHILLVEDERKLAAAVAEGLHGEGYVVTPSSSGEDALRFLRQRRYDMVLLDIMLPGRGGLEVLAEIRASGLKMPVLMLTSKDSIEDRVQGLDAGADDYLVKPFAFAELLARVRALSRRNLPPAAATLEMADLSLELEGRTATRGGKRLELNARELDLLEYLLLNRGSVVTRDMLAREVWKQVMRYTPLDNVIDVQIARLRRKLDADSPTKLLHTVRGVGFVLREEQP